MTLFNATVEESIDIAADRDSVWHALTDPASVATWDSGIVAPLDAPQDYPRAGQIVRWRYRLLGISLTLVDRPQEVVPLQRLRTLISLAILRLDETYTLDISAAHSEHTRLSVRLDIGNTLPIFRRAFDRWIGKSLASRTVAESLYAIRDFCETK